MIFTTTPLLVPKGRFSEAKKDALGYLYLL